MILSLFVNRLKLEVDCIVEGRRFQNLGVPQLKDLSPKVISVVTFGDADKIPESLTP